MLSNRHILTSLADVKKTFSPKIFLWIGISIIYKRKKDFVMKKLIALSIAVVMLLLGFATAVEVNVMEEGISVCDDIEPQPEPYDNAFF